MPQKKKKQPKSKYRGVSWHQGARAWQAQICMFKLGPKHNYHLGYYKNQKDASDAYEVARKDYEKQLRDKYGLKIDASLKSINRMSREVDPFVQNDNMHRS